MDFIELAARVNEHMPDYIAERVLLVLDGRFHGCNPRLFVVGVAFKRDVVDPRYSPAIKLTEILLEHGADVQYYDPFVPSIAVAGRSPERTFMSVASLRAADCVVIATDHRQVDYHMIVDNALLVFDVRNVTAGIKGRTEIVRLGGRLARAAVAVGAR